MAERLHRTSLDFIAASTVESLRAGLEAQWASLLERGRFLRAQRDKLLPGRKHREAEMQDDSCPVLQLPRVLGLERADTGRALDDAYLSEISQRPHYWFKVVVHTSETDVEIYVGSTTQAERTLFLGSSTHDSGLASMPRVPPRREEYRRTDRNVAQLYDEARRVVAAEPDMALPAHWEGAMNTAEVRLEIISFLLEHDCKMKQIPQFSGEDIAVNIERMAAELELRWVRENPVHIVKFCKFDYAMEFRRILEIAEERQYATLRLSKLTRWVTTEFWDSFNIINGGDWVSGSLASGHAPGSSQEGLLAWRPSKKPLQELWKKCVPHSYSFPFYFELLEDHQLVENIHDKIVEMAIMMRQKLGAQKLPWWRSTSLPFVISGITKQDARERIDNETLRNDLKRESCLLLHYEIFSASDSSPFVQGTGPLSNKEAANIHKSAVGQDRVVYESLLVRRGAMVSHPVDKRPVRMVQVMSLRGDTLDSGLETIKYIRKTMLGKRERTQRDLHISDGSSVKLWEYRVEDLAAHRSTWIQYGIHLQDRLNRAWLSGEGCDWTAETKHQSLERLVPKCSDIKHALVVEIPSTGPTFVGFQEPPSGNGIHIEMDSGISTEIRGRKLTFTDRLRRLEGMSLVLQRKRIKTHFRRLGLFVQEIVPNNQSKRIFLVITAANHKFAQLADEMKLRTKLAVNLQNGKFLGDFCPEMFLRGAPILEFWNETVHRRYPYRWFWHGTNPYDPADCFTGANRLKMLNELVTGESSSGVTLRIAELRTNDVVTRFFPLHDEATLEYLRENWAKPWNESARSWLRQPFQQDIETVRDYFGVHIAFYFEWLGFYTKWLMAPTVIGVLVYFSKQVLHADYFQDILKVEEEHDLYPYFALFMALWATLFLEFWKRTSDMLLYRWDIQPQATVDHVRPKYVSDLRKCFSEDKLVSHLRTLIPEDRAASSAFSDTNLKLDLAQHDEVVYYPPVRRTLKHLVTYPLMLAMIVGLVTGMAWIYVGGLFLDYDTVKASVVDGTSLDDAWRDQIPRDRYFVMIGIANGVAIPFLNVIYKKVAVALTEWELHRTFNEFNEALALKLFMFQFVNSYASLFFIAFYSRSFHRLQFQLFFVMFVGQVVQNFVELGMPALMRRLRSLGSNATATSSPKYSKSKSEIDTCSAIQNESLAKVYDDFALSEDYLEMTIQFGFATMFVVANPLIPLLALLNNLIEIRVDASKLCFLTQRPEPRTALGIGLWQQILQFMAMLAVVTNFAIIVYTKLDSEQQACGGPNCVNVDDLQTLMDVLLKCDGDNGEFPCRSMDNLLIALALEHFVVLLRFVCSTLMMSESSKPKSICADEFKESYYHLKARFSQPQASAKMESERRP